MTGPEFPAELVEKTTKALLVQWMTEAEAGTDDSPRGHCERLARAVLAAVHDDIRPHVLKVVLGSGEEITGETSDGYHTFNELYEFRLLYNAALFNAWAENARRCVGPLSFRVHKSWRHSDGEECFGGDWFIVMATLPAGQISNHYEAKDWDLFQIPERERAEEWDGHSAADVALRLNEFLARGTEAGR